MSCVVTNANDRRSLVFVFASKKRDYFVVHKPFMDEDREDTMGCLLHLKYTLL